MVYLFIFFYEPGENQHNLDTTIGKYNTMVIQQHFTPHYSTD